VFCFRTEIARLQAAREHEKKAADALGLHAAALRAKQVLERRKAAQFQREVMNAACDASKRLRRAEKFKDATTIARKQVTEVQKQVREEVAGLATYALELKKSIGVDVAAFYAMAAKFNFIETTQTESTREKSSRRLQKAFAKYQAALTDLDDDLAETVEAKQEAEEKLAAEKDKFATVEKKLEDLTTERTAIETAYEEVKTFLDEHRGGKKHMQVYKLDEVDTVPTWLDTQRDDGGDVRRELEDPREFEVDFKGRFERRDENADQGGMRRFMNFMGLGNQITGA
jgi:chromosome segregation ATPase